jgi:hypothetical protein
MNKSLTGPGTYVIPAPAALKRRARRDQRLSELRLRLELERAADKSTHVRSNLVAHESKLATI